MVTTEDLHSKQLGTIFPQYQFWLVIGIRDSATCTLLFPPDFKGKFIFGLHHMTGSSTPSSMPRLSLPRHAHATEDIGERGARSCYSKTQHVGGDIKIPVNAILDGRCKFGCENPCRGQMAFWARKSCSLEIKVLIAFGLCNQKKGKSAKCKPLSYVFSDLCSCLFSLHFQLF